MHVESIDASLSIQDGGIDLESKTKLALVIAGNFQEMKKKRRSLLAFKLSSGGYLQANVSLSSGAASPVTITP